MKSMGSRRKAYRAAAALRPLGRLPPMRWVLSALTAVYGAVSKVLEALEIVNLTDELNEYSLIRAVTAVAVDAGMGKAESSP